MRNHPFLFVLGFALGYLPILYFLANVGVSAPQVLAEDTESEQVVIVLETEEPEETSIPTATPKPTPSPTPAPTPLPTPTPSPTEPPEPTPTPDVWSPPELEPLFAQYAGAYGVDKNMLERIANCESHFNENAVSPNGLYVGMFQFAASTWQTYRSRMGMDTDPDLRKNAEESIKTAAFLLQQRGPDPWKRCLQ